MERPHLQKGGGPGASGAAVWAWVLYDFANTIFSVTVLTLFFPLWVEDRVGGGAFFSAAGLINAATAVSALLVVLSAPVLGAVADFRQRRVRYLVAMTLAAVALTAALDLAGGVAVGLAVFVAADLAYQSALVFYNALLPAVSAGRGEGRVSGYGTAAGYVGTILALIVLTFFVENGDALRFFLGPLGGWLETGEEANSNAFLPTAVLYLVFSLPAFFLVPDPAVRARRPVSLGLAYRDVYRTLRNLSGYAGVGTFILATVLYTDAANTTIANMALYGRVVFGMGTGQVTNLLLFSTVFAVVGSTVFGFLCDRGGPKRTLLAVLVVWFVAIVLAAGAPGAWMLFVAGPFVGVALGGMWTVGRVMLVALSPPEKLGEFFGLFSLAGKVSAVFGPALTTVLLFAFGGGALGYRISIGSLAVIMAAGIFFLLRVPDARPGGPAPLDSPSARAEDVGR
ncbi:MAG TPA: MFS transporter [Rubrobacter sp.]|nr:MFS transporter [Rubrobacter sp.]